VLGDARSRGEELLAEGRRAIEQAVRDIRTSGADQGAVRSSRETLDQLKRRLPPEPDTDQPAPALEAGDRIRIPHLGLVGSVIEVRKGRVVALAEGLRLSLDRTAVRPLSAPADDDGASAGDPAGTGTRDGGWAWSGSPPDVTHEIDLRGLAGEEAWEKLDRLIDRATPAGLAQIRVIHGMGTGRLRAFLLARLRDDPRVAGTRQAALRTGGFGVTVVQLAD
jgi:DNA mismatch repair protein MutS2